MTTQPPRSYTRLAIAIVVAALVIGTAIYASSYAATTDTVTKATTTTTTMTATTYMDCTISSPTGVSPCTTTQTVTETSNGYDLLVFRQITPCPNLGYLAPWSVTLSNGESARALNANFSQCCSASPSNPSVIAFLVANGNYSYSTMPSSSFTPGAGTVAVDNQEVVVELDLFFFSCGSTTTTG